MIVVSHSGTGLFLYGTWERVARDSALNYPINGVVKGIGPLLGFEVDVVERDLTGEIFFRGLTPDMKFEYEYEDGILKIHDWPNQAVKPSP